MKLLPCGCLPNKGDAHRVGCPDFPEGKPYRGTWLTPYGPEPMKGAPVGFVAARVRMHEGLRGGWSGWGHELTHTCGWSTARRYAESARDEALRHDCRQIGSEVSISTEDVP